MNSLHYFIQKQVNNPLGLFVFMGAVGIAAAQFEIVTQFSVQLMAVGVVLYLITWIVVKNNSQRESRDSNDEQSSITTPIATSPSPSSAFIKSTVLFFSFLTYLLLATTGGFTSAFFPFAFLVLLPSILLFKPESTLLNTGFVLLLLYLGDRSFAFSLDRAVAAISLVALLPLTILGDEFKHAANSNAQLSNELTDKHLHTVVFVSTFMMPKLRVILQLTENPVENQSVLQTQLARVLADLEELLDDQNTNSDV